MNRALLETSMAKGDWSQYLPRLEYKEEAHLPVKVQKSSNKPKMYVVDGSLGYFRPWEQLFERTGDVNKADVGLFTGGADISPRLYNEPNVCSGPYEERDAREIPYFRRFKQRGIPMIGICRGAQLICALNGGKLFQHVNRHAVGAHELITHDGVKDLRVSSLHHQMLRPSGEFELHGWSGNRSDEYISGSKDGQRVNNKPDFDGKDPEVVWYPKIKAYCIQGHPEFMDEFDPAVVWFRAEVKRLILK